MPEPTLTPAPEPTVPRTGVPTIEATEPDPEPTAIPTAGPGDPGDTAVIERMSFSVTLPGVDLPEGAVLCLENVEFAACAPLESAPVASIHPALLVQAADTYIATFVDLPAGTYALTIPPIGSFPGYRGSITIDREMPSPIAIDIPEDQSAPDVPGIPDQPAPPDEAPGERSPFATPIADGPAPFPDAGEGNAAGAVPPGDGTSGSAYDGTEEYRSSNHPASVTTLPSTGTGQSGPPGVLAIGAFVMLSLMLMLRAIRAVHGQRR